MKIEFQHIGLRKKKAIRVKAEKKRHPDRDRMIEEGCTLLDIAEACGCSKQNISQYIRSSNQYEVWMRKRGQYRGPEDEFEIEEILQRNLPREITFIYKRR